MSSGGTTAAQKGRSVGTLEDWLTACSTLHDLGVTHVFGLPGTQTVPLYEALRRTGLTSVVPTSELSAAFMAGAFYRASGRLAVLATIPGPGFAWAVPGLAEARQDSAALLHLTLAAPEGPDASFRLQPLPQTVLGASLAKASFLVSDPADVGPVLRRAHETALQGEPGPVIVTLGAGHGGTAAAQRPHSARCNDTIESSWLRLAAARRPLLLVGQGSVGSAAELTALAESLGAPVLATPGARGIIDEQHPLCMPFDPYRGGGERVRSLVAAADLVLVLGARLGHNGTAGHSLGLDAGRMLQVDADPAVCGAAYGNNGVVARVEEWLAARPATGFHSGGWSADELAAIRSALRYPGVPAEPRLAGMTPSSFFRQLREALPPSAMLVTDTGLHQVLTRRHFEVRSSRGLMTPADFQSMGFGLPAAIAARLACPQRTVAAVVGDGSLAMNGLELATAASLRLPLPVFVFADGFLNQIRLHQAAEYGHDSGVALPAVDLALLAAATGARYAEGGDVGRHVRDALAADRPTLIAVHVTDSAGLQRVRRTRRAKELLRHLLRRTMRRHQPHA